jgi:hypothetical protein
MDPQITDPRLNKTVLNGLTANKKYRIHMWGKTENGRGEVSFIEVTTAKSSGMSKAFYCRVFRFLRVPKKKKNANAFTKSFIKTFYKTIIYRFLTGSVV